MSYLAQQSWIDRRSEERNLITLEAKARRPSGPFTVVTITDVSCDGFATLGLEPYSPGTEILVYLPGLAPRSASVVWQHRGRTGSEFADPLHPAVVKHLAEQFA